ncbi:MAG: LamG domain-containing protein [Thermodesulfovibrionales bacterium]|nr:LamG domain-containing protein [Thermodesulfovibrionales bacterium]
MNEGSGNTVQDLSGNGNAGTLVGNTYWAGGKFGPALDFDGTTDYVTVSPFNKGPVTAGTYSFWLNYHTVVANDGFITSWETAAKVGNGILIFNYGAKLRFSLYNDAQTEVYKVSLFDLGGPAYTLNTWQHWVCTFDSSSAIVYLNSIEVGRDDGPAGVLDIAPPQLYFGSDREFANRDIDGQLDVISIYNRALSASEIQQQDREPFRFIGRKRRRIIYDEIAGGVPTTFPYYYREIASRRIA